MISGMSELEKSASILANPRHYDGFLVIKSPCHAKIGQPHHGSEDQHSQGSVKGRHAADILRRVGLAPKFAVCVMRYPARPLCEVIGTGAIHRAAGPDGIHPQDRGRSLTPIDLRQPYSGYWP